MDPALFKPVFVGHIELDIKILDFGVAKVCTPEAADDQSGDESLTLDGVILGTTSYMSPEQVRGEELDARSDLFSFGIVLYEMATNRHPFAGKNPALIMNAILNAQPATVSNVSPSSPAALDAIIARALEKDLEKRFQSAADICSELKRLKEQRENDPATVTNIEPLRPSHLRYLSTLGQEPAAIQGRFEDRFSEKQAEQLETRRTNLPVQRTGFVGREKEVAAAKEILLRQDARLVTVTGPGGIGKTRLAVQVATGLVERFPGGTHFVPLASLSDPDLIASVIVQTLGIREGGSQSPLESERSLWLAGAAAALRKNIGAPLTPAEGVKLEASLYSARQALTNTVGDAAWSGGWDTPVEKAIEDVLVPESESPSHQ